MDNEFRLSFTAEEIDEKLRKVDSMGESVQSDWNQTDSSAADFIKNKPFGDMPTGGDTLYWDGNTEGLANIDGVFFRVSDVVPTKEDFLNGCSVAITYGSQMLQTTLTSEEVQSGFSEDGLYFGEVFQIVPHDNYTDEFGTIEKKGIYLLREESGAYLCSLTIPGYTGFPVTKKMDEKYLPGAVILYSDDKSYLCSDSGVSERITKTQLVNSFENGRVLVDLSAAGMPCKSTITGVIEEENYAMGLVVLPDIGAMGFYTAEYTAS